ncbi:MAG: hypothetical protein WCX22_10785, partial [Methanoregula sp.]
NLAIPEKVCKTAPILAQNSGKVVSEGVIRGQKSPGFWGHLYHGSGCPSQAPQKRPYLKYARYGPGLAIRRSRFPVPREMVSTPTEKTAFWEYFQKPGKKRAT